MEFKMNRIVTQPPAAAERRSIEDGAQLLELARGWLSQGNTVVAEELLRTAIDSEEASSQPELRARILKETGRVKMMQSDWQTAETYYLEAQRLFCDLTNPVGASECARNRGNMAFQQGRFDAAERLCEEALSWSSQTDDHQLRATILNTLAAIKSATGSLSEAIRVFRLCLADFQAAGNVLRQGYVLLNIGLTHIELRQFDEAIEGLNDALAIGLSERDLQLVEICYQNIAKAYLEKKEVLLAQSVLATASKILPGLNAPALEAELKLLETQSLRLMGDTDGAARMSGVAFDLAKSNGLHALMAQVLMEQGVLFRSTGERDRAMVKFTAAARQYRQLGMDKKFQEAIAAVDSLDKAMVSGVARS